MENFTFLSRWYSMRGIKPRLLVCGIAKGRLSKSKSAAVAEEPRDALRLGERVVNKGGRSV